RGERRTRSSDDDDRCDERAKFAAHGDSDGAGNKINGAKFLQLISCLQRKDQSDKKSDKRKNRKAANADLHGLRDSSLETDGLALKRRDNSVVARARRKHGQRAKVGERV